MELIIQFGRGSGLCLVNIVSKISSAVELNSPEGALLAGVKQ